MKTRTVKIRARPVEIPIGASVSTIVKVAQNAGLIGSVDDFVLQGYHRSGGAEDLAPESVPAHYDDFGFARKRKDNSLGSGRQTYWPAPEGALNVHQIRAAVLAAHRGNRRVWPMQLVLRAPRLMYDAGRFGRGGWDENPECIIIRNTRGEQFDDRFTLPEAAGRELIEAMCRHADDRRAGREAPSRAGREAPSRDDRIEAAVRSYAGRRTKREGWPWLRPLRRHARMADISAKDRKRVCAGIEAGG